LWEEEEGIMARAVSPFSLDHSASTILPRDAARTARSWSPRTTNLCISRWKSGLELKRISILDSDTSHLSVGCLPFSGRGRKRVLTVRAARMESKEVSVGFRAPEFELPEPLTGKTWKLDDFEDQQGLLVMFICNHCPFVIHLKESLASFAKEFQGKGLGVVAISSNSVETHPEDGPRYMAEDAKKFGYTFPYLFDETQEVAKAYGAVCTPDFFLFKKDGRKPFELAYHGRFDETRPRTGATPNGKEMRAAVTTLLSGQPISSVQKPSIGCSIKWHPQK
jgi:peroxiredoxin